MTPRPKRLLEGALALAPHDSEVLAARATLELHGGQLEKLWLSSIKRSRRTRSTTGTTISGCWSFPDWGERPRPSSNA